jgi:3-oxoacyl-[acyl-carrier-protein] synthase III
LAAIKGETMTEPVKSNNDSNTVVPFFKRPTVTMHEIPVGNGVPFGTERISNPDIGIGGAYGTWGYSYDNTTLADLIEENLGAPLGEDERMDLAPLGFIHRHHLLGLSDEEQIETEVSVGSRLLQEAAKASGWKAEDVDAVLIGMSGPPTNDYIDLISDRAGIRKDAMKVIVHKACDGSAGALHLALNPDLIYNKSTQTNLAEILSGKKVLVGGIEGLSRFVYKSQDKNALQLFGNGAGIIGVIPGETMQFLVGKTREVFDEQGVLAVRMYYPHSGEKIDGQSLVEITQFDENHIRFAGLMNEPKNGAPVEMVGNMGMVKLFVRNGAQVVRDVYQAYREKMSQVGSIGKSIEVAIVHHANLKINSLKQKTLSKYGIELRMPWVIQEFGNVSAASNMIAFLRELPSFKPGDHIMIDGFGAGTYYDVFVVALGKATGQISNS